MKSWWKRRSNAFKIMCAMMIAPIAIVGVEAGALAAGTSAPTVMLNNGDHVQVDCAGGNPTIQVQTPYKSAYVLTCHSTPPPTTTTTTTKPPATTTTTTKPPATTTTTTAPPATTTTTSTTIPSSPTGLCTSPSISSNDPSFTDDVDDGHNWVSNDSWSGSHGPQTMNVCSASSWYADSNQPNVGGQVETYPDTEYDVGGRDGNTTKPISAFNNITSTFAEQNPSNGNDGWDAGYDLWTNGWSNETMIWNQWAGAQAFWPMQANGSGGQALSLGGVPYHFFANGSKCNTTNVGGCELMFFRDTQVSMGSVDLLAAFNWEVSHGYAKASDVPTQLEYGTEVCYTQGTERFNTTGFSINIS